MTEGICPLVETPDVLKILVIDDCTEDRSRARRVFERAGLFVIEARDGLAALQSAVEEAPHVILLAEVHTILARSRALWRTSLRVETAASPACVGMR